MSMGVSELIIMPAVVTSVAACGASSIVRVATGSELKICKDFLRSAAGAVVGGAVGFAGGELLRRSVEVVHFSDLLLADISPYVGEAVGSVGGAAIIGVVTLAGIYFTAQKV